MNSLVDLNQAVDSFLTNKDKKALVRCMECSLSEEKFLQCIYLTKRYDLLPRVEHALGSLFKGKSQGLIYNMYLDLLLIKGSRPEIIRNKCLIEQSHLAQLMVERNVNIFSLSVDFTNGQITGYFMEIIERDNFNLYLELEKVILVKLGKKVIIDILIAIVSPNKSSKILEHFCKQGGYKAVLRKCLDKLSHEQQKEGYMSLIKEICSRYDCGQLISQEYSWEIGPMRGKELYMFMLSLGARPSAEQKAKLQKDNPRLYKEIFNDDV